MPLVSECEVPLVTGVIGYSDGLGALGASGVLSEVPSSEAKPDRLKREACVNRHCLNKTRWFLRCLCASGGTSAVLVPWCPGVCV